MLGASFTISGQAIVPLAGLDQGYFAQQGLDVSYVPTGGSGDLVSKMVAGQINIGQTGAGTTILSIENKNIQLEYIGMVFERNPDTVFYANGQNVSSPKDLAGKTIATVAGAEETLLFPAYLKCENIDPNSVHLSLVASNVKFSLIGQEPVLGFLTDQGTVNASAAAAGKTIAGTFLYSGCLKGLYGNGWAVLKSYAQQNPDVLRRFLIAMAETYEYACTHPALTAQIAAKDYPALGGSVMASSIVAVQTQCQLLMSSDVSANGWMWMTSNNWNNTIGVVNNYEGPVNSTVAPSSMFTNQFNPGIKPSSGVLKNYTTTGAAIGLAGQKISNMAPAGPSALGLGTFFLAGTVLLTDFSHKR